jgi:2-polyprenyl-6-methoxyphenol hydroxylase-like FAD-dependent oxidoreductase
VAHYEIEPNYSYPGEGQFLQLESKYPVIIAGAGPIGLILAIELGNQGIDCLVVEQGDGNVTSPKMLTVGYRTMEFCRRWGFADKVTDWGWPLDYPMDIRFATSMTGYEIAGYERPSYADRHKYWGDEHGPEVYIRCPQSVFDPLLAEQAASFPSVTLQYGCRLKSFKDHGDHVEVMLNDVASGENKQIKADYIAACDGALSRLREAAGIGLSGVKKLNGNYNIFFHSTELLELSTLKNAVSYILYDGGGHWASMQIVNGVDLWRLDSYQAPKDAETADPEPYLFKAIGREFEHEIIGAYMWNRREGLAENYRKERIFLVGDSAHQLSPTGGFGMNTGVADAVDLGWKLAAVLKGWGGNNLLDSYETERRPIAARNVGEATENYKILRKPPSGEAIADDGPKGVAQRAETREFILGNNSNREWESTGLQLGYRYEDSPIIVPDGTAAEPIEISTYAPSGRPGGRAPHAWLSDGRSTLDLFGTGFTLLQFTKEAAGQDVLGVKDVPIAVTFIDDPAIHALYGANLVLVRPDGHIAWRGNALPDDVASLIDKIRGA